MHIHNKQRYHFILSSFLRLYGVEKINQDMKLFTQKLIDENTELDIANMDLKDVDKYIQQMFESRNA